MVLHISIPGGWACRLELCFGGAKQTKDAHGDGTVWQSFSLLFNAIDSEKYRLRDMSSLEGMSNFLFTRVTRPKVSQRIQIVLSASWSKTCAGTIMLSFEHNWLKWSCARMWLGLRIGGYFTDWYFTANWAEAGKRPVFWKSVPEAGNLKINNLPQLWKNQRRISQFIMALVVNHVRTVLSAKFICCYWCNPWCDFRVTHTQKCNEPAKIQANY